MRRTLLNMTAVLNFIMELKNHPLKLSLEIGIWVIVKYMKGI